jgi:hypothetical protein
MKLALSKILSKLDIIATENTSKTLEYLEYLVNRPKNLIPLMVKLRK